jgi:large subunit ribosomal protein L11
MKIKLIVDGGAMKPCPAVAQQLGPMGINLGKVIEDVNKETAGFKGVKVPVELDVDAKSKNYTIKVFSPPTAELIKKELKLEKASGEAGKNFAGNIAFEKIVGIAKTKMPNLLARDMRNAVKLVLGSCTSLGVLVDSKTAIEIGEDVNAGKYENQIENEITEVSPEKQKELDTYFANVKSEQDKKKKASDEAKAAEEAAKAEAAVAGGGEKKEGEEKKEEPKKVEKKVEKKS